VPVHAHVRGLHVDPGIAAGALDPDGRRH
jgi:hypothetical protein